MKRVIIVDDEIEFANNLAKLLIQQTPQLAVTVADSAEEAMKKFEELPADILITDLKLPKMNGLELSQAVSARWPNTAIIVMTAYGTEDVIKSAFIVGALFYIEKPFKIEKLSNMIRMADLKKQGKAVMNKDTSGRLQVNKQQGII